VSFPDGFLWGVATSAYQVEGAVAEDGRGDSIWDTFARTPGATRNGETGDVACDQYHRFEQDAALMADLGIGAYRFSVAWPRIQPEGRGPVNQRGLDHYRRLVDALRANGIAPVLTLFHWDLPQPLEDAGGWPTRDTALRFAEYAGVVHAAIGGDVEECITINEPWVAAWLGYATGTHAPGHRDDALALSALHHLLLAHGLSLETIGTVAGIALNLEPHRPATDDPADVAATGRADRHMNATLLDPLFGRGYPKDIVEHYRHVTDWGFVHDGDLDAIARPLAFLGLNYYRSHTITAHPSDNDVAVPGSMDAWTRVLPGSPVTATGWPIDPPGLREILERLQHDYAPDRILITENGAAFDDIVGAEGVVDDDRRISYLAAHVDVVRDAIRDGLPIGGYFVWSLLDNFEWAEGYEKRFGLVGVDVATQARVPKASAAWYRTLITNGGDPAPSLTALPEQD
jgi:beta-glucosidase